MGFEVELQKSSLLESVGGGGEVVSDKGAGEGGMRKNSRKAVTPPCCFRYQHPVHIRSWPAVYRLVLVCIIVLLLLPTCKVIKF